MGGGLVSGLREFKQFFEETRDVFGNDISDRTNVIDLAAHYPYSPVRWRLFVDGSRVFPEYNTVSQYTHDTDRHLLEPNAGETVVFESTERPRYVVQYEVAATFAWMLGQSLADGDRARVGLYDGTDGWYFEQRGADHADDEGDLVIERAGSTVYAATDITLGVPTTQFARLRLQTGWYDVTINQWEQSYARRSTDATDQTWVQKNKAVGWTAAPEQRGPRTGNLPLHYEITASDTTTDLTMEAGSCAQVNLGRTVPLTRDKVTFRTVTLDTANAWVPVCAYRVDPERDIVNVQVEDFTLREIATSADTFGIIASFAPETSRTPTATPYKTRTLRRRTSSTRRVRCLR